MQLFAVSVIQPTASKCAFCHFPEKLDLSTSFYASKALETSIAYSDSVADSKFWRFQINTVAEF